MERAGHRYRAQVAGGFPETVKRMGVGSPTLWYYLRMRMVWDSPELNVCQ